MPVQSAGMEVENGKVEFTMVQSYALLGMLGMCSLEDYKRKQILVYPVLAFGIVGVVLHMYYQDLSITDLLLGSMVGILLFAFALGTRQLGCGDALVLMVSGIYLGFWENVRLLFHGVIVCGVWSLLLLVFGWKQKKDEVAFVPFLLLAYLGHLVF